MTERMAALLQYANYQKIGDALGIGRAAVQKWSKGINVGPHQVEDVERLYREGFGLDTTKTAPPEWAERLERKLNALLEREKISPDEEDEMADARAVLEATRTRLAQVPHAARHGKAS